MGILAGGLGSEGFLRESPHLFVWLGEAIEFWEKVDGLLAHSVVSSWLEVLLSFLLSLDRVLNHEESWMGFKLWNEIRTQCHLLNDSLHRALTCPKRHTVIPRTRQRVRLPNQGPGNCLRLLLLFLAGCRM